MSRREICGGIASGKTTLARLLKDKGAPILLEDFQANPFWEAFYRDPAGTAFETELTFFLQHYHGMKVADDLEAPVTCDHSLLLDLAYARVTLSGRQHSIFEDVFEEAWSELGAPKLLVYLRCDPEIELARVRERGRDVERSIDVGYLAALNDSLKSVVEAYRSELKVHEINSGEVDFAHEIETQRATVKAIQRELGNAA